MTLQARKSSIDISQGYDYGEHTLLGLHDNFDTMFTYSNNEIRPTTSVDKRLGEHANLLGRTTATTIGLTGIRGFVTRALHEPSGQSVAVKRYKLDGEKNDTNLCHNSQEKFNEDVTFIMVRKYGTSKEAAP